MKITDVREMALQRHEREQGCLAKYDIVLDDQLLIHNIIVKMVYNKVIVEYPSYRTTDGWKNYCRPVTKGFGEYIKAKVLDYYEESKRNASY